jgi:ribosomal protein L11 methyltransferase
MAFGTGVHETTQLCMEALEDFLKPGMRMLDVGTGSGILARAASLLGAGKVYACDTDPVAVEIAGGGFIGSADAVAAGSCDLVAANISPEAIIGLAPDLVASSFRKWSGCRQRCRPRTRCGARETGRCWSPSAARTQPRPGRVVR